jgi:phosphatidylserine synthase
MKILITGSILMAAALLPTLNQFPPPGSLLTAEHTWHTGLALVLLGLAQEFKSQIPADITKPHRFAMASLGAIFIAWIAALAYQDLQILIALPLLGYIYYFPAKKNSEPCADPHQS